MELLVFLVLRPSRPLVFLVFLISIVFLILRPRSVFVSVLTFTIVIIGYDVIGYDGIVYDGEQVGKVSSLCITYIRGRARSREPSALGPCPPKWRAPTQ